MGQPGAQRKGNPEEGRDCLPPSLGVALMCPLPRCLPGTQHWEVLGDFCLLSRGCSYPSL